MVMEDDYTPPPAFGFFSSRAKFNPREAVEEFQAAANLVDKIEEENSKLSIVETAVIPNAKTRKRGKKNAKSQSQKNGLDDSFSDAILSSASKRRLKKLREEQALELQRIEAENERILSAVHTDPDFSIEAIDETAEDFKKITVLTIMYISEISRLKCYENDKFLTIFPRVAELFNLKVGEFLLCLKARNINKDDTPKSLKITSQDVLECIPYKAEEFCKLGNEDSENTLKILFQSNDSKKKIEILALNLEKMQGIMKRYAEQRDIPLEQLVFEFDGEKLSGEETPAELDMESESCIDVTVLVPAPKTPKKRGRKKK